MRIPRPIYEEMVGHCRAAWPLEACGLLAADSDGRATRAYCLANLDASPTAYTIDPSEHVRALYDAEDRGWRLAAVFHSHPDGPAVPSRTDVAKALEPEWLYVIVGLVHGHPSIRGFRILDGAVSEELIVVEAA